MAIYGLLVADIANAASFRVDARPNGFDQFNGAPVIRNRLVNIAVCCRDPATLEKTRPMEVSRRGDESPIEQFVIGEFRLGHATRFQVGSGEHVFTKVFVVFIVRETLQPPLREQYYWGYSNA